MPPKEPQVLIEFYFMRHAESVANLNRIANGSGSDSKLTQTGENQTRETAAYLNQIDPEVSEIYHSEMYRAVQSGAGIADILTLPQTEKAAFNEQMLGEWEGLPWEEAAEHFLSGEDPPKGENYASFHHRIMEGLKDIAARKQPDGKIPLIVSHGGVWLALNEICGKRTDKWPENCDIFRVRLTGDWQKPVMKAEQVFKLPLQENHLTFDA